MTAATATAEPPLPSVSRGSVTPARLGTVMLGLLALQLLLGMGLNLYVALPSGSALAILVSSPLLILHSLLAVFLVGIATRSLLVARRLHEPRATAGGSLALASALVATAAGASFAFGDASAAASFTMTAGFVGMMIGAVLLLTPSVAGRDGGSGAESAHEDALRSRS